MYKQVFFTLQLLVDYILHYHVLVLKEEDCSTNHRKCICGLSLYELGSNCWLRQYLAPKNTEVQLEKKAFQKWQCEDADGLQVARNENPLWIVKWLVWENFGCAKMHFLLWHKFPRYGQNWKFPSSLLLDLRLKLFWCSLIHKPQQGKFIRYPWYLSPKR